MDGTNNLDPLRRRLLNDGELAALQGYIHNGGGFVGLHAATDSMHTVLWYSQLTGGGARFVAHPQQQTAGGASLLTSRTSSGTPSLGGVPELV